MFIGKVTGNVVATQKEPNIAAAKLLTVEAYSAAPGEAPMCINPAAIGTEAVAHT